MSFFLVLLEPDGNGNMVDVPIPAYGPYEKGSDAAKYAKTLTEQMGRKVQPRRIAQAADWRGRQAQRLAGGALKPLPGKWDLKPITDHFAHLHPDDFSKIAFTENDELGVIDRVTILTPGRYISRFYPEVNDDHRRKLIASIDPSGEIFFATTPEEITKVYKEGPSSCMDNNHEDFFDYPCWPTAPYGAGDLAVAYTMNDRGRIQSRTLCWPAKKQFGRVYGDIQRMTAAMKAEGFEDIRTAKGETFVGAKLLKVLYEEGANENEYVLPYFDDISYAIDNGDHFITAAQLPEGSPGLRYCNSGGTTGVAIMYQWCPQLKQFDPECGFRFVHGVNEEWSSLAIANDAFHCHRTGEVWTNQNKVYVKVDGRTEYWSNQYFEQHGEVCSYTKQNYPRDEIVTLSNGSLVHKHYKAIIDGKDVLDAPQSNGWGHIARDFYVNRGASIDRDQMLVMMNELTVDQMARLSRTDLIDAIIHNIDGTVTRNRRVA